MTSGTPVPIPSTPLAYPRAFRASKSNTQYHFHSFSEQVATLIGLIYPITGKVVTGLKNMEHLPEKKSASTTPVNNYMTYSTVDLLLVCRQQQSTTFVWKHAEKDTRRSMHGGRARASKRKQARKEGRAKHKHTDQNTTE